MNLFSGSYIIDTKDNERKQKSGGKIMNFLLVFLRYLIEVAVLAAMAGLGIFLGIKLRKNKDAKLAAEQTVSAEKTEE